MRGARRALIAVLAGATLIAAAGAARPAAAVEVMAYFHSSAGPRHSWDVGDGLDLRLGLGGHVGAVGLELETGWTADHPFHRVERRAAARHTTWLDLQLRIPLGPIWISVGGGPGLGWIKEPDPSPTDKLPSHGFHEYIQITAMPFIDEGFLGFGVRIEPQHLWQDGVLPGVEHSLSVRWVMWVGGFMD